jgi:hypothetical protein
MRTLSSSRSTSACTKPYSLSDSARATRAASPSFDPVAVGPSNHTLDVGEDVIIVGDYGKRDRAGADLSVLTPAPALARSPMHPWTSLDRARYEWRRS